MFFPLSPSWGVNTQIRTSTMGWSFCRHIRCRPSQRNSCLGVGQFWVPKPHRQALTGVDTNLRSIPQNTLIGNLLYIYNKKFNPPETGGMKGKLCQRLSTHQRTDGRVQSTDDGVQMTDGRWQMVECRVQVTFGFQSPRGRGPSVLSR